jgi:hypothetical protein
MVRLSVFATNQPSKDARYKNNKNSFSSFLSSSLLVRSSVVVAVSSSGRVVGSFSAYLYTNNLLTFLISFAESSLFIQKSKSNNGNEFPQRPPCIVR